MKCENHDSILCGKMYHDTKNRFMLLYMDKPEDDEKRYVPLELPEELIRKDYTYRCVYDVDALNEKTKIAENGLNDVAIERMKFMVSHVLLPEIAEKGYELCFDKIDFCDDISTDGAIDFLYTNEEKGEMMRLRFDLEVYYQHCLAVETDPRMKVEGCMCIDQGWMRKQLSRRNPTDKRAGKGARGEYRNGKWALVNESGEALSEYKYAFVEDAQEGYFRAQVTGGSVYNLLRPDGSELLTESFSYITDVCNGYFMFWRTIRKTKTSPTRYLHGIGHVSGVLLFPPLFECLSWLNEDEKSAFYAEREGKPYVLTIGGGVFDPARDFTFFGIQESVCEKCIFATEINENGEGCGFLAEHDFRRNYLRGRCEHRKTSPDEPSPYEKNKEDAIKREKLKAAKQSDTFSLSLTRDFIQDYLNGDIDQLKAFDFNRLKDDKKYGRCNGFCFTPEQTDIVKAIASLLFADAWGEVNYENIEKHRFVVDQVNPFTLLFGVPLGMDLGLKRFKGMDKFAPSSEQTERAYRFWHLHKQLGNLILLPSALSASFVEAYLSKARRKWREYPDSFIKELQEAFAGNTHRNSYLQAELRKNNKIYANCLCQGGFERLIEALCLTDYTDANGNPRRLFAGISSMDKGLDRDTYFEHAEAYLDFCERVIPHRAALMVERLKKILS